MASSTQESAIITISSQPSQTSTLQSQPPVSSIDRDIREAPIDIQQGRPTTPAQQQPIFIDTDAHFGGEIIIRSRPNTPILEAGISLSPPGTHSSRSRHSTPALDADIMSTYASTPTRAREVAAIDAPPPPRTNTHNIEEILVKQGRQIRALYELQKSTFEKVSSIQTQVKKLSSNKNTDLSTKVFGVSSHNLVSITFHI